MLCYNDEKAIDIACTARIYCDRRYSPPSLTALRGMYSMATFTNRATISWGENSRDSNVVTGEILEVLSMSKNTAADTYLAGDTVTYVISLRNTGASPFTALTVTDDLGAYTVGDPAVTLYPLTYVVGSVQLYADGILVTPPTVESTSPLVFTGITVPTDGSVVLIYEAQINAFAPQDIGTGITNTATVSGGGLTAPLTDTAVITAEAGASLTISKALCPESVTDNGQITYTFVIQNSGNTEADAADGVVLRDIFDPILDPISVTYNGTPVSAGTFYTYDASTGTFETLAGVITVPAATYTQDPVTGIITTTPGTAVVRVTGTV